MEAVKIITASEFRANQRRYFELAEKSPIVVTRAGKAPIMISVPDMAQVTEYELQSIQKGLQDIEEGRTVKVDVNDLWGTEGKRGQF